MDMWTKKLDDALVFSLRCEHSTTNQERVDVMMEENGCTISQPLMGLFASEFLGFLSPNLSPK